MATGLALIGVLATLSIVMTGAWAIALRTGQSGWIDSIWSFASGLVGAGAALIPLSDESFGGPISARQWLVAVLCALWGLRLGSHIAARTAGGGDDPRYAALKAGWGDAYPRQLFWFLQVQAIAAFILALAAFCAGHAPGALQWTDWIGVVILIVSIGGEAIADRQLVAFRRDPASKGRICERGLWAWSRHPNYFFEWLVWCAYVVIAAGRITVYWPGIFTLLAPVMMYWLLVHVSGIPPLEEHMRRSRGIVFDAYAKRVSVFFPRPPHKV